MLHITKTVATRSAVYDTDDGSLEWVFNSEIEKARSMGFQFKVGEILISQSECNFGKNKENIFKAGIRVIKKSGNVFEIASCGKKFKVRTDGRFIYFNCGIRVPAEGVDIKC